MYSTVCIDYLLFFAPSIADLFSSHARVVVPGYSDSVIHIIMIISLWFFTALTKKDLPSITNDAESMPPVQMKRTRSRSTTPASDKYNVSKMKDTYIVDRRYDILKNVTGKTNRTYNWQVFF